MPAQRGEVFEVELRLLAAVLDGLAEVRLGSTVIPFEGFQDTDIVMCTGEVRPSLSRLLVSLLEVVLAERNGRHVVIGYGVVRIIPQGYHEHLLVLG